MPKDARIVEVGCGNGTLLCAFAEEGFSNLTGTDYSASAIELARKVAAKDGLEVAFHVRDLLNVEAHADLGRFALVLDKGTYDAITLAPKDEVVRVHCLEPRGLGPRLP